MCLRVWARLCPSTRCADGKDKAKMEGGGGCAVQMADAASAGGSCANGTESPAGRSGSVASGDWGSRRDGSWASNGSDMRNGGVLAGYPGEAEDQEAEPSLIKGAGPSIFRRTCFRPPSPWTQDSVPVMSADSLMDAVTTNRRLALVRIEQGH